jgi:hypothetical protein
MAEQNSAAIPDFSFDNKFYLDNILYDEATRTARKNKVIKRSCTIEIPATQIKYNNIVEFILNTKLEVNKALSIDILSIELNLCNLMKVAKSHLYRNHIDFETNKNHQDIYAYVYIFGLPIYLNEELHDNKIIFHFTRNKDIDDLSDN